MATSPDGDQLAEVQLVVVDLRNKDGRHGLVQRRAVHVDGGAHWQHEAGDLPVHVTVLQQALHGDRQGGRAADGGGGNGCHFTHQVIYIPAVKSRRPASKLSCP